MPPIRIILFDDAPARRWQPFALTRPAGELLFGAFTQRVRAERAFGAACVGHIAAAHLRGFDEPDASPVLDADALPADEDLLFLSARAVPAGGAEEIDAHGARRTGGELLRFDGEICGWLAPAGAPRPPAAFFLRPADHAPAGLPVRDVGGVLLRNVWELVARNTEQLSRDLVGAARELPASEPPAGVQRLGAGPLLLGADVRIEPGVVLDLSAGPIRLDDGVTVRAFTRLAGPAYIGRGTTILGGSIEAVSIGPACKVRGEVEESVVLGYSNKAHDGFLGHAYVGAWVNLGALTTNSDLKNNYGPVRVWTPDGVVDTGESKLGCLIGDHVKTAIGTLFSTGTVVGAGANVFGSNPPPTYLPPFRWGTGDEARSYDLDRFLSTAETVMARRRVDLSAGQRRLLSRAWEEGVRGW